MRLLSRPKKIVWTMSKLILFDFVCDCGAVFEELIHSTENTATCPRCGSSNAKRQISAATLDPRMGLDSDFTTMWDRWEKRTRARAKQDNMQGDNLWMY